MDRLVSTTLKAVLLSFLAGFSIILIQLFTREVTLDKIRGVDFNLIYNFVNTEDNFQTKHLQKVLNSLTTKDNVLFPIAILKQNNCIDNSQPNSNIQICKQLKNMSNFEAFLNTQKILKIENKNYVNHSSKFFMYKQFTNTEGYLIGHAGKYVLSNELEISKFFYFLQHSFIKLITTNDGRIQIWEKSRDMLFTIIFLSLILGYLYVRRIKINLLKYKELVAKKQKQKKEWGEALHEQKLIKETLQEKEDEIAKIEKLLKVPSQDDEELQAQVSLLKTSKDTMILDLQNSESRIKTLEQKEQSLIKTILEQSKRLAQKDNSNINEQNYTELSSIKKLWRLEPKWSERSSIETLVATKDGKTPFTITQAFISFDSYILARAARKGYKENDKEDLYGAINFLQDNNLLKAGEKGLFHKIRMSRNSWFHHAKYPNEVISKKLISILELENQKPPL